MTETLSGGCQCGRVRYEASVDSFDAYWCHCRMCQRAVGNVAAAFDVLALAASLVGAVLLALELFVKSKG